MNNKRHSITQETPVVLGALCQEMRTKTKYYFVFCHTPQHIFFQGGGGLRDTIQRIMMNLKNTLDLSQPPFFSISLGH